jgi:8-oxo-dGTP pyrophosphatase MutT (NUDIX family)
MGTHTTAGDQQVAGTFVTVEAAGGVVWRDRRGQFELLLVHRPAFDDWSFPKGRRQACDRSLADTARREVREETGWTAAMGTELLTIEYVDRKGRHRHATYWEMRALEGKFRATREIDASRWVAADRVHQVLTFERDRQVLAAFRRWCASAIDVTATLERYA